MNLPIALTRLIEELNKLPGIGTKTAQRLAFYLLKQTPNSLNGFGQALVNLKEGVCFCQVCSNIAETEICSICSNDERGIEQICVVAEALDVIALEKAGVFKGCYHVLQGIINPLEGVGPDDLTIDKLMTRLTQGGTKEVIIATNPTMEGESTAIFLQRKISPLNIKVSRIAKGMPMGGDIEYADEVTLSNALSGRIPY